MTIPSSPVDAVPAGESGREPRPRELDLFAFAILLLSHLRFLLACGLIAFVGMAIAVLVVKPRYASTAVMIVPQTNPKLVLLETQLPSTASGLLGGGDELYADLLQSRTVADQIIKDYNLQKVYRSRDIEAAEGALASFTKVTTQPEGVLRVTVQDTNPRLAADIANDYLHQLDVLNSHLVLTSAGQRRVYLERAMIHEKDALADAEVALKQAQESTSGLPPEAEANAALSALETTRVQLRAAQVRLGSLLQSETEANPEVVRLRSEIAELSAQLAGLENGSSSAQTGTPTSKVPEQTLVYTRRLRDVKFHEALFDAIETQYESAKQEEAGTPSLVQVLDPAVPPLHKAWPPRTLYCVIAGFIGFFIGIFLVVLRAFLKTYASAPPNAEKLRRLKSIYRRQFGLRA